MKEHKLENLPIWARHKIEKLKADIIHYKGIAEEIKGDKETNTYVAQGIDEPLPLPKDAKIIFVVNPEQGIQTQQIQVRVLEKNNEIEIYASKQLNIRLHSSNICHIKQEDWRG